MEGEVGEDAVAAENSLRCSADMEAIRAVRAATFEGSILENERVEDCSCSERERAENLTEYWRRK